MLLYSIFMSVWTEAVLSNLPVIARCAKRAVAIQPLDTLGALSLLKRLDYFVARVARASSQ